MKKLVGSEDNQVAANGSAEESVKNEAAEIGSINDVNCCSELLEEDKPEDVNPATEEIRPVKKAKSSTDDYYHSSEVNNGLSTFGVIHCIVTIKQVFILFLLLLGH